MHQFDLKVCQQISFEILGAANIDREIWSTKVWSLKVCLMFHFKQIALKWAEADKNELAKAYV